MTSPAPPRRRCFRFSLRTLFVVVTLFCVWLGYHVKWIHDRREAREWESHHWGMGLRDATPTDAPWSIRMLGEPTSDKEVVVTAATNDELKKVEEVRQLFPELIIVINNQPD